MDTLDEKKTKLVVIDSRDRDTVAYETPDKYIIDLPDDIQDVAAMKLMLADVPFSSYTVGTNNNRIPFCIGPLPHHSPLFVAVLPVGDYSDPEDMATCLTQALNNEMPPVPWFNVTYSPRTDNFVITGKGEFALVFGQPNTAGRLLGFSPKGTYPGKLDETSSSSNSSSNISYVVTAPFRRDFSPSKYVVLNITPSAELLVSANNATNRSFAILPRRMHDMSLVDQTSVMFEKTWTPPLSRIARIAVELTDYDGNPYDFQNQEHRLQLLFTCMKHRRWGASGGSSYI